MNRLLATVTVTLAAFVLFPSCNCGGPGVETDAGVDSGLPDAGAPDAGAPDAGEPDAGVADAGSSDAGASDAGATDAGTMDAGAPDAGAADAGADAGFNALFAHIGGRLVLVNPLTGALTELGPTGQQYLALAWDVPGGVARAVIDTYSPVGGSPTPRLGVIDLCTGNIDAGPPISVGATQVRRAEALAQQPDSGAFFITVGRAGTGASSEFLTESNGTVNVSTGAVTIHGNHQTLQDDGDALTFVGPTLYLLDIATALNQGTLYSVDTVSGQATARASVGPRALRIAWDATRQVLFVAYGETTGTNRGIGTLDLDSGVITPLGANLPDMLYPSANFTGLLSAPARTCP